MAATPRARLCLLLGAFFLTAILSAAIHPDPLVPVFLLSLAAASLLALALACLPSRVTVPALLVAGTIAALTTLAWVLVVSPNELARKSLVLAALHWTPSLTPTPSLAPPLSPNLPGMLAAISAAGWTAFALSARRRSLRAAGVVLAVASLAVVLTSGSRSGMLAAAAGMVAVLWLRRRTRPALATAVVLGGLVAASVLATWDRFERAGIWAGTVQALVESPIVGRGIGSFPVAYVPGSGPPDPVGAHNTLLQIAIDLGLLGVLAFLALLLYAGFWIVRNARVQPEALVLAGTGIAWVSISLVESTVIATARQQEPWFGWQELVTPLAFVFFGTALAPFGRSAIPNRRAVAAVLGGAAASALVALALSDTGLARPAGISDAAVLAAARSWTESCAAIHQATPPDCPQAAGSGDPSRPFDWAAGTPLLENTRVSWSSTMGLFIVTGNFNLRYDAGCSAVRQASGATPGILHGYFVVGLRAVDDRRRFGASELNRATPQVAGFAVVNRYRWQLACD